MDVGLGVDVTEALVVQPVQSRRAATGTWAFTLSNNVAIRTEKLLDLTCVKRIAHATVLRIHSGDKKGSSRQGVTSSL